MHSFGYFYLGCLLITLIVKHNALPSPSISTGNKLSSNSLISIIGTADLKANSSNGAYTISTNLTELTKCASLTDAAQLTQTQLIQRLTANCRYDRLEPPLPNDTSPVDVYARIYISVLQNIDSTDLQLKLQGLLQLRFKDARLAFQDLAPQRQQPIMGESSLRELIWVPHIFLSNEQSSSVLGRNEKDILTNIQPDGTVIISSRLEATVYCWMNFQKFPFDEQKCSTHFESWMYNTSVMQLHWEPNSPVSLDPTLHLPEYELENFWHNETIIVSNAFNMRHGALMGNYSSISFTVQLTREVGYYILEYFLPSIMIVAISWVTFWLQADQTPARTTLGATTMLSFITLSLSQENNLSKVSYITLSEVWFLVCTSFIFLSLVEFAFVNTIWRRNNNLELKKRNAKYIMKSTLTPNLKRAKYEKRQRSINNSVNQKYKTFHNNSDTIIAMESPSTPIIVTDMDAMNNLNRSTPSMVSTLSIEDNAAACGTIQSNDSKASKLDKLERSDSDLKEKPLEKPNTWSTMTPKEVSIWIDRKMRFVFPLAFIVFNALFWTLVYCL